MNIQHQVPLANLSTMKVEAFAESFFSIEKKEQLQEIHEYLNTYKAPYLVLGGGSNILFSNDFKGIVLQNKLHGKTIVYEDDHSVKLNVASGENWHELVSYCVEKGWGGIENLALIPGTVGAAPIQNIGAYGVELIDVFVELEAFHIATGKFKTFRKSECKFGYRDSVFKHELKDQFIICSVTLELQKNGQVEYSYASLKKEIEEKKISNPGIRDIFEAVIKIRRSKLPGPDEIGNNGSFFKNPVIPVFHFDELKQHYPELPSYPVTEHLVKLPAGWLIDNAGWKGYREGDAGVHEKQALVLVNYGKASGQSLKDLAEKIQKDIHLKYGIHLVREVNVIG